MAVNRLLLPAITGWSLGRAVFGIRVVHRRDGSGGRRLAAAGPRPGPPAGHRCAVRWMALAAVGFPAPHIRRSVVAHRGSAGGSAAARHAPTGGEGVGRRGGGVCGGSGVELCGGIPPRAGGRSDPAADRGPGATDRRTDAELRQGHPERRLRAGPVAGYGQLPVTVGHPAAGGGEGRRNDERVLGGEQRGAVGVTGPGRDAARHAGPTWHKRRTTCDSSPRRCGRTSRSPAQGSGG